jgi:UDP-N-acetylmuramyl pentapeptide phosphotransferase/UDP-N-acetylglucosamine-1-phosphate transferase
LILTYRIFGRRKKRDFETTAPIPNSCGVIFLFILILSSFLINPFIPNDELLNLIIGSSVICISGFWDDLKELNPYQKLLYQLIAVSFVVYYNELYITNLHGFIGIGIMPFWSSFLFTCFIGIFMINAFNLIDGIDGLAGFSSIISFASFAILFWILNFKGYFGISILMIGLVLGYLPYNFNKVKKVFMGDSGSMLIGYILFVMTMLVINNNEPIIDRLIDRTIVPIAPMVIFIIPMIDTFSVYTNRLIKGGSPFSADRSHVHHIILSRTNSHLLTSLFMSALSLILLVIFSMLAFRLSALSFICSFFVTFFVLVLLIGYFRKKTKSLL